MNERSNYTKNRRIKLCIYIAVTILVAICIISIIKIFFLEGFSKRAFSNNKFNKDVLEGFKEHGSKTIVIDPGHGGRDGGTKGQYSLEKENTLPISLKLGKIIKQNHPSINVIYTRTEDIFVPLLERADLANRNNADLFISIHCNSDGLHFMSRSRRNAYKHNNKYITHSTKTQGTETYILNTDILLEDNIMYVGPKLDLHINPLTLNTHNNKNIYLISPTTPTLEEDDQNDMDPEDIFRMYTGLDDRCKEPLKEPEVERLKKSYALAQFIEKEFANDGRKSRGVHESHFLVLRETSMPAVLIETGFMTNLQEEAYLHSDAGRERIARAIYNALTQYIQFVKSSI